MRTKIRGLVFVGFAAAVFAQSALAVSADDKTVTSKTYVDTNFQNLTEKDPTTGTVPNDVTSIDDESTNDEYPTSRNVYKFVKSELIAAGATGNITGNINKHTQKIAVFESGYNGNATNPSTTDLQHLDHWELIVPDSVVAESGSDIGGTAQDPGPEDGTDLTTAQAVYDFVTGGAGTGFQRKLANGEKPSLGVYNADGTSVWKQAAGGTYVSVSEPQNGNSIDFDIKGDKIASHGADDTSGNNAYSNQIVSGSPNLTTANAVYEYVQNNVVNGDLYQPKAESDDTGAWTKTNTDVAGVGIRTGSGTTADPYVSSWYSLGAGQNGNLLDSSVEAIPYARIYRDDGTGNSGSNTAGVYLDLDHARISVASTYDASNGGTYVHGGIANINSYFSAEGMALATAGAVKEYVDSVNPVPSETDMPAACKTGSDTNGGGHVCALVAYYDATLNNNAGGVKYEWTVMAPTN